MQQHCQHSPEEQNQVGDNDNDNDNQKDQDQNRVDDDGKEVTLDAVAP